MSQRGVLLPGGLSSVTFFNFSRGSANTGPLVLAENSFIPQALSFSMTMPRSSDSSSESIRGNRNQDDSQSNADSSASDNTSRSSTTDTGRTKQSGKTSETGSSLSSGAEGEDMDSGRSSAPTSVTSKHGGGSRAGRSNSSTSSSSYHEVNSDGGVENKPNTVKSRMKAQFKEEPDEGSLVPADFGHLHERYFDSFTGDAGFTDDAGAEINF